MRFISTVDGFSVELNTDTAKLFTNTDSVVGLHIIDYIDPFNSADAGLTMDEVKKIRDFLNVFLIERGEE